MYIVYIYLFKFNRLCCALLALSPLSFAPLPSCPYLPLIFFFFLFHSFIHVVSAFCLCLFLFSSSSLSQICSHFHFSNQMNPLFSTLFSSDSLNLLGTNHFTLLRQCLVLCVCVRACLPSIYSIFYLQLYGRLLEMRAMIKCLKLELFYYRLPFLSFIM